MSEYNNSELKRIKDDMDKPLSFLRKQDEDKSKRKGWIVSLLVKTCFGFKIHKVDGDQINKVTGVLSSFWIPLLGYSWIPLTLWIKGYQFVNSAWVHTALDQLVWIIPSLLFVTSLLSNFIRMLNIGDPMFHIAAYRIFMKSDYEMKLGYISMPTFTFDDQITKINTVISDAKTATQREEDSFTATLIRNIEKLEDEKQMLIKQAKGRDKQVELLAEENSKLIESITKCVHEIEMLQIGFNRAVDVLHWIKEPPKLKKEHLALVSDYSLFIVSNQQLVRVDELGTTNTPKIIPINDARFDHYSSVQALKTHQRKVIVDSERQGRSIASYLYEVEGRLWLYNLHYYSARKEIRAIIETEEFYRLIEVLLTLLIQRNLLSEGDLDGSEQVSD